MKRLFLVLVLFVVMPTAIGSSLPDFPFIGVEGVAKMDVSPDTATVRFHIMEFSEDPQQALNTVMERSGRIVEFLEKNNIPKESIESADFNKETERQTLRDGQYIQTKIIGYKVTQSFIVTIDDLEKYVPVVDNLVAMKNIININSEFGIKNKDELVKTLVIKAGKDAKAKAENLAAATGVTIKSVHAVVQDEDFEMFFARFGLQEKARSQGVYYDMAVSVPSSRGSSNMFVPSKITLKKSVGVVYKIK